MATGITTTYDAMKAAWTTFEENHQDFMTKQNKSAGARAKKSITELRKFVTQYRKESIEMLKSMSKKKS